MQKELNMSKDGKIIKSPYPDVKDQTKANRQGKFGGPHEKGPINVVPRGTNLTGGRGR